MPRIQPETSFIRRALDSISETAARQSLLTVFLHEQITRLLRLPPSPVDPQQPITAWGLDSLMAIELKQEIETQLGAVLSIQNFFQDHSISELADQMLESLTLPLNQQRQEPAVTDSVKNAADSSFAQGNRLIQPIAPKSDGQYSLSFAQQRLGFLDRLSSDIALAQIPVVVRLTGPLDTAALEQSLNELVKRHSTLRTFFPFVNGQLSQVVVSVRPFILTTLDLGELSDACREDHARQLACKEALRPFDLAHGPLMRAVLFRLSEKEHLLFLVLHHMVSDGWSMNILNQELATLYDAACCHQSSPLAELPIQYVDWAAWQKEWLQGTALETQLAYWKEKLAGWTPMLDLPTDHPRPAIKTFRGATHSRTLTNTLGSSFSDLNRRYGVTPFMAWLAALKIVLFRWTGQADITVGTVVADRNHSEVKGLIGCLVNFLALRCQVSQDLTALSVLKQAKATTLEAFANQDCPFEKVIELVAPRRLPHQGHVYNVALIMQNVPARIFPSETLRACLVPLDLHTSLMDLRFIVYESFDGFRLECEYDTDLFEADTIRHLVDSYSEVLEILVLRPETRLSDVKISPVLETKAQVARKREQQKTVTITATFTAAFVEDTLRFWLDKMGIPAKIEFAPYNQVFQQLLAPDSLLVKNRNGVNIVLIRFEDWARTRKQLNLVVSPSEQERILAKHSRYTLPNGAEIAQLHSYETEDSYQEIFDERCYFQHGISLHEGDCVVDVGANIGLFTLFVQQECNSVRIYAVEPAVQTCEVLRSNVKLYCKSGVVLNCGLADENKEALFNFYPHSTVFSGYHSDVALDAEAIRSIILGRVQAHMSGAGDPDAIVAELFSGRLELQTFRQRVKTLSAIIRENGIEQIDLLKIDVERSEQSLLKGIEQDHWPLIRQIVIEVHDREGQVLDQITRLLQEKGFKVAQEETRFKGCGFFYVYATRSGETGGLRAASPPSSMEEIRRSADELLLALKDASQRSMVPYLVCLCPPSPAAVANPLSRACLDEMQERLASELERDGKMHVIRTTELLETYPVSTYYDSRGDSLGHIPFTQVFFTALGTMLARKIYAIESIPYKVIVLDCDNTLWQGVCGEDGALGVKIDQPRRIMQEFMIDQHRAGMLLCLCSKNHEADVLAVFDLHPDMRLKREHLVAWRINWQPKSVNIRAMAQELQLGLDSFIFLDDDPVECAEVRVNCPQVLTLQLPYRGQDIAKFLRHVWVFDHAKVTEEDQRRTVFYMESKAREELRVKSLTIEEFLAGLDMQIHIAEVNDAQLARVSELTQRTNQFNMTTIRRSESELRRLFASNQCKCLVAHVCDRFGDYGLVGVIIFKAEPQALVVDTFLLSCRALGRGVEYQMLARLGDIAKEHGLSWVHVLYIPTPKNEPALNFLEKVAQFKEPSEGGLYKFPAEFVSALTYNPSQTQSGQ